MIGPKTTDHVFLMYSFNNVGYIFLIINSILPEMNASTIMRCIDTTFLQSGFLRKNTPSTFSHEFFIPEIFEPIIHVDFETHIKNLEGDNTSHSEEEETILYTLQMISKNHKRHIIIY